MPVLWGGSCRAATGTTQVFFYRSNSPQHHVWLVDTMCCRNPVELTLKKEASIESKSPSSDV
ncbi:hypothetical protein EYF80_018723 [Liparis tanakae]|uniref:Uncharacterized protein n=1 Tax=Liparis tanakae TaxID=230148 RepID=A0A4Z2I1E5_9TELE|nr:hypothetical protein EYF80_018723 [Liparis tanakae]